MTQIGSLPARRSAVSRALALGASAVLAGLASVSAVPAASAAAPPPVRVEDRAGDHLTVTVRHAGPGRDGTYRLYCHPAGGSHPDARRACDVLDRNTHWGREPFAPVPAGSVCTMQYGGPATARITGTWAGRRVDAAYDRGDGCRIDRWNRLVPLLPDLSAPRPAAVSRTGAWAGAGAQERTRA
ncbi:SSI family serine proteinase inhibitor [Streptomyces sp. 6-11-2]|uniref:SSI family serine proteinase inhibitor n=1 Tax=Streptomyces sp. 6-11-2 TaxID=2585753 RepID=UPI001144F44A|nr:SSI family serine proteinase inhibitor [Streptomyces sp. 6-11-2]